MKIKLRDLDEDVLAALKGSTSSSAEIQALTNQLNELTNIVQSLKDSCATKDTVCTKDEAKKMGLDLKTQFQNALTGEEQKYVLKQEGITETMLDENLQYKVNARYNNVYAAAGGDGTSYESLKQQVFQLGRTIDQLKIAIASAVKVGETIPASVLPSGIQDMLNAGVWTKNDQFSIEDFNVEDRIKLTNAVNSDASIMSGKLSAITDFILKSGEEGSAIYATTTPDDSTSDYDKRKDYGICGTAKMILDNSVAACFSSDDVNSAKNSFDEEEVMDSSGKVTKKQIPTYNYIADFSTTNKYYSYNNSSHTWEEYADAFKKFCGQFIGNETIHSLYYITPTEAMDVSSYINPRKNMDPIELTIGANDSKEIVDADALGKSMTLLIYDDETGSATNGKWLNAAPYGYIAIEDGKYTIYNDTDAQHRFMVVE